MRKGVANEFATNLPASEIPESNLKPEYLGLNCGNRGYASKVRVGGQVELIVIM